MTPEVVREVLASSRARRAISDGRAGEVIRLVRTALGLRLVDVGALAGYSKSAISRIETGLRSEPHALAAVAKSLGIPPGALDLPCAAPDMSGAANLPEESDGDENVKRSDFLRGMAGVAGLLTLPSVLTADAPHVSGGDVEAVRQTLAKLYELDASAGAGRVRAINIDLVERLRYALATGSCTPATRRGLQEVLAAASENLGWASYDAGLHDQARRWWLEALHAAGLGGHHEVRTVTLASMSLQASALRRGPEAVDLAEAAERVPGATPVVRSIVAARLAMGHAAAGNRLAADEALVRADRFYAAGRSADDPAWTSFWCGAEIRSHETQAAIALHQYPRAERAARESVTAANAAHPRNTALYTVRHARLLAGRRAVDEAIQVGTPAVAACGELSSGRLRASVRMLARQVGDIDTVPACEFAAWATQVSA